MIQKHDGRDDADTPSPQQPMTAPISPASVDLLDRELAAQWAGSADLPSDGLRWRWFRGAMELCVQRSMARFNVQGTLDGPALADAFFRWASQIDSTSEYRELDPLDYAHFSAGLLLRMLLSVPVLKVTRNSPPGDHGIAAATTAWMAWPEAAVLTRLALTFLDASRRSAGAAPLELAAKVDSPAVVASFYENVREDPALVSGFFDEFTGVDPQWSAAAQVADRPAIQRALEARQRLG